MESTTRYRVGRTRGSATDHVLIDFGDLCVAMPPAQAREFAADVLKQAAAIDGLPAQPAPIITRDDPDGAPAGH